MQSAGQPSLPARTALLALAISLTLVSIPLQATANSEKTQEKTLELNELRGKIRRLQNRIRRDTSTEDQLSNKLRETELQISNVSRNLSRISREIRSHQKTLKGLENERKALQSNLREQQQLLASQVRAAFAMGRQEQIKLILNQQDPARVGRTLIYYDYLNRARSRQIKAIDTTLEKLGQVEQSILEQEHTLAVAR